MNNYMRNAILKQNFYSYMNWLKLLFLKYNQLLDHKIIQIINISDQKINISDLKNIYIQVIRYVSMN